MLYCEDCRIKKRWNLPATYPYHEEAKGKCEVCGRLKDCYSYPALYVKLRSEWGREEIFLDNALQREYHQLAEGLVIAYVSGSHAGASDYQHSEELKNVIVRNRESNKIDWFATYKLRQRVQEGYRKDELNRDRRKAYE
jgi:hypothetical protein